MTFPRSRQQLKPEMIVEEPASNTVQVAQNPVENNLEEELEIPAFIRRKLNK
jgi:hypothetical protein